MDMRYTLLIMIGFFLIIPPVSALSGNWTEVNASAEFTERKQHTSVVFDNKMWVIGGYDANIADFLHDVWYSSDGNVWYQATSAAAFPERGQHSSVVFDNKMWIIGGQSAGMWPKGDIWNSTDGILWKKATDAAEFSARYGHSSVIFAGKIWVIGGYDGGYKKDVWYSYDGITWNKATDTAAFPGRNSHTSVVYDNKMWVIGGYDGTTLNDVWYSSDGITWTEVTPGAALPDLYCHTSVVYDNNMWVIGGLDGTGAVRDDVWYSSDGATWTAATVTTPMPQRELHTSVVSGSKIWTIGGFETGIDNKNDTWSFLSSPVAGFSANLTSGSLPLAVAFTDASTGYPSSYAWTFGDGGTSSGANPVHSYSAAGTYTVSHTVTNRDGTSTETKTAYITVTDPVSSSGSTGVDNGGDDPPASLMDVSHHPMTVNVNVGGNSAVFRVIVSGTGVSDLIVTGNVRAPPGVNIPPAPGTTYQYIDLVPARFITITGSEIFFSVPVAWLEEYAMPPENIIMYHYTGTIWEPLPTTVLATRNSEVWFSAKSSGFSVFAISGTPGRSLNVSRTSPSPQKSVDLMPLPEGTPAGTQPAAIRTTSPPPVQPDQPAPELLFTIVVPGVVVCAGFLAGCVLVRRWWIRRQNPALFRKYP